MTVSVGISAFWNTPLCSLIYTDSEEHAASIINAQPKHPFGSQRSCYEMLPASDLICELWGLGRNDCKGSKCPVFFRYKTLSNSL